MTLYCGAHKVTISPDLGTPLAGYGGPQRKSSSIHDPLHARVIVVRNREERFVIISLDLVGVDKFYVEELTGQINNLFKIPKDHVFMHATHTHSASGGIFNNHSLIGRAFKYMNGYLSYKDEIANHQQEQILKGIESAINKLEPCEMFYGESFAEGIATNRNSPEQPYDSKLRVVEFQYSSGEKIILYHFACHPTVMGPSNTLISADLPGLTSKELEDRDDICLALFLNGPSADISTRFTRKESSFKEVDRLGNLLTIGVLNTLKSMNKMDSDQFQSHVSSVELQVKEIPDSDLLHVELNRLNKQYEHMQLESNGTQATLRQLKSKIEGVSSLLDVEDNLKEIENVDTYIQVLRIGNLTFLAIPGELYFETGQAIINIFDDPILIAGNTNDHLGYIVPNHYYEEGYYESYMTLLEIGSNEIVKQKAIDGLKEVDLYLR